MNAITTQAAATGAPSLLAELRHADHIIKVMLNALTTQQQARVGAKLEAAGVAGEGMTRHHERAAAMAAAVAAPASASTTGRMAAIAQQAGLIVTEAQAVDGLLQGMPSTMGGAVPPALVRSVALMRGAAQSVIALAGQGGAA